jgi:hypothetical protein
VGDEETSEVYEIIWVKVSSEEKGNNTVPDLMKDLDEKVRYE